MPDSTRRFQATMPSSLVPTASARMLLLLLVASGAFPATRAVQPDGHSSFDDSGRQPWQLRGLARSRREAQAQAQAEEEGETVAGIDDLAFLAPGEQYGSLAATGAVSSRSQQEQRGAGRHLSARVVDDAPSCNVSSMGQLWYARPDEQLKVCDGLSWKCTQKEPCPRLKTLERGPTLASGHTSSFLSFTTLAGKRNRTVQYLLLTQNHGDVIAAAAAAGRGGGGSSGNGSDDVIPGAGGGDVRDAKLYKVIPGAIGGTSTAAATTTVLRQTLSLGRVKVAKTVWARGQLYLAVLSAHGLELNGAPDGNAGVVTLLPWSGKRFRRRPHHELRAPRPGAVSMDTFVDGDDGDAYLVLVGTATGGQYGTWITVYRWTALATGGAGEKFRVVFDRDYSSLADPAQRIAVDASHVRCFRVSGYQFAAVSAVYDGRGTRVDSHLFRVVLGCGRGDDRGASSAPSSRRRPRQGCVTLRHRQRLPTVGAMSAEFFSFPAGGVFLAFAGSVQTSNATGDVAAAAAAAATLGASPPAAGVTRLDVFRAPSHVYRLDFRTQRFVEFQRLETLAADAVRFFRACDDVFLAVTCHLPDAVLRQEQQQREQEPGQQRQQQQQRRGRRVVERTAIFRWRGVEKFRPWLSLPLAHRSWSLDVLEGDASGLGTRFLAESRVDGDGVPSSGLLELGRGDGGGGGACGGV